MDKPAILSNPEAFVVVPVEPDGAMLEVYRSAVKPKPFYRTAQRVIRSIFAARPDPAALADIVAYCAALEAENARLWGDLANIDARKENSNG